MLKVKPTTLQVPTGGLARPTDLRQPQVQERLLNQIFVLREVGRHRFGDPAQFGDCHEIIDQRWSLLHMAKGNSSPQSFSKIEITSPSGHQLTVAGRALLADSDNRSARSTLFHAKARLRAAVVIDFLVALKNELVAPLGESGTS